MYLLCPLCPSRLCGAFATRVSFRGSFACVSVVILCLLVAVSCICCGSVSCIYLWVLRLVLLADTATSHEAVQGEGRPGKLLSAVCVS